ncbi:hypothetical protein VNO78_23418 [Psophocarpus tetragonolobus]|uniref:Uncharacterized protein n=1 Tax=Psophocarpus tetragonolobus TaxID=3891 RepID=A0AAN9S401_PSOTE
MDKHDETTTTQTDFKTKVNGNKNANYNINNNPPTVILAEQTAISNHNYCPWLIAKDKNGNRKPRALTESAIVLVPRHMHLQELATQKTSGSRFKALRSDPTITYEAHDGPQPVKQGSASVTLILYYPFLVLAPWKRLPLSSLRSTK